jgi:uncharacterized protein YigA (DUF484 family)
MEYGLVSDLANKRELSPLEVAAFLRRNTDFLTDFPDLALVLKMPRQVGSTTSLASYQLDVLREKNRALHRRLQELIAIAGDNEQLVIRVHDLTLGMMRAQTLDETLQRVVATLCEDFSSDTVRVLLYRTTFTLEPAEWLLHVAQEDKLCRPFLELMIKGEPVCGRLDAEKLSALFAARANDLKSCVMIPIVGRGLIAIGSADANRFHPGMGTLFLKLIADAVGAAMMRFDRNS